VPVKKPEWIKLEVAVDLIGDNSESLRNVSGNALLYLARDSISELLKYGDIIATKAALTQVDGPENPESFDYQRYLHFKNIHHQAFIRDGNWKLWQHNGGNWVYSKALEIQARFLATLRKHLKTPDEIAVGSALILGYHHEIPEEIQIAYAETGALHVLAVSGLHVAILFGIMNYILGRIKTRNKYWSWIKMFINLIVIWGYALVTGATPSVLRSSSMFSFVIIGMTLERRTNIYNTLTASAFLLLLLNPYWIASVSFQLSYLAVLGIVYFQNKLQKLLYLKNKILSKIWAMICISLGAQLMTLPISIYYFKQFPSYFWLSSLILVPATGVALGAGLLLLFLEMVIPALAPFAGTLLWLILKLCNEVCFIIQKFPGAVFENIWISSLTTIIMYLMLVCIMVAISFQKIRWMIPALSLLAFMCINYAFRGITQQSSSQMVVYSIYKQTAIDIFDGENAFSFVSPDIDKKSLKFAVEGKRSSMGIDNVITIPLNDTIQYKKDDVAYTNHYLRFQDNTFIILDKSRSFSSPVHRSVDYIIVRDSPYLEIEKLAEAIDFKMLIFDASNKKWLVEKWKLSCEQLNLSYHDVGVSGALELKLN
jgi:competence protein ComEC